MKVTILTPKKRRERINRGVFKAAKLIANQYADGAQETQPARLRIIHNRLTLAGVQPPEFQPFCIRAGQVAWGAIKRMRVNP